MKPNLVLSYGEPCLKCGAKSKYLWIVSDNSEVRIPLCVNHKKEIMRDYCYGADE